MAIAHYEGKGLTFNAIRCHPDDNIATELIVIEDSLVQRGHMMLYNAEEEE